MARTDRKKKMNHNPDEHIDVVFFSVFWVKFCLVKEGKRKISERRSEKKLKQGDTVMYKELISWCGFDGLDGE